MENIRPIMNYCWYLFPGEHLTADWVAEWRHFLVLLCCFLWPFKKKKKKAKIAALNGSSKCMKSSVKLQQASFTSLFCRLMKTSRCQESWKINQRIYGLLLKRRQRWCKAHAWRVFRAQFVSICKGTNTIFLSLLHYVIQPDVPAIYLRFILSLRRNSFFRIYLFLVEAVIYR